MITKKDLDTDDGLSAFREQWLDKLWLSLFDGGASGLLSPGQIRRERRNREQVRQIEMAAILQAEAEFNDIHQGLKSFDANGNIIDTPRIDMVSTHRIIENTAIEQHLDVGLSAPAMMIKSVVKELSVRDLERTLNLRKIAILAERIILDAPYRAISQQPVNAEWMLRWRETVVNVINPELQLLWSRMLIAELARPGSYSLGLMSSLLTLSVNDLEMVLVSSKYAFDNFIYDASADYFDTELHRNIFEVMEELGLLTFHTTEKVFSSERKACFQLTLACKNKALQLTHADSGQQLTLSVFKLSRVGRQLFELCDVDADLAYLFHLARYIKAKGFQVTLGDWHNGKFIGKITL